MLLLLLLPVASVSAQRAATLTPSDSALVARLLTAERDRDSTSDVFALAAKHPDARIGLLARRAVGRIRDPLFVLRDSLPAVAAAPVYAEPAWRLRFRALTAKSGCTDLETAVADSAWPVRFRAADLTTAACSGQQALIAALTGWMQALPNDAAHRAKSAVSWHAGAHALEALARAAPAAARTALPRYATHAQWQVRRAAAHAALTLADTALLRALLRDKHNNVQEAAIDGLSKLVGHEADDLYLAALGGTGAQAVRAAAIALKGSPRADVRARALQVWQAWAREANASERDARVALLEAAGRSAGDDSIHPRPALLPPDAVRLALGAPIQLRVTMEDGGGSFLVRLRGDVAPIMAGEILTLAKNHYYDGLTWHRVEHDFVIQGGSPDENEFVGFNRFLRDELGTIAHPRGTVGMSTRGHDTGDAQWFVNLRDNARLRRDYTVFGEVVEGIDVVDAVLEGDRIKMIRVEQPPRP